METTIISMEGLTGHGRKGSDKPFKRQEYVSQIEEGWRKGVAAPTDGQLIEARLKRLDAYIEKYGNEALDSVGTEQRAQEQAAPICKYCQDEDCFCSKQDAPKAWQPSPGERIQVRRTKGSSTSDWLEGEFVRTFEMHIQGLPAFRAAECRLISGAISNWFDEFRPLSTWITHDGGPCPVVGQSIMIRYRDGTEITGRPCGAVDGPWWHHQASHSGIRNDIVAYKVIP